MSPRILLLLAICALCPATRASDTLVAQGAVWRYLDDGSNQGTAWRDPGFNDSTWNLGLAQLGYGDGDEATVVSFGPNASNKYITTYFRHEFNVPDPSIYTSLTLQLLRDDGIVVYLNGTELVRDNMPGGTIGHTTRAGGAVGDVQEDIFYPVSVPATALVVGTNDLAVEIHQDNPTSSDISLDLMLLGETDVHVHRGPYLQTGTPTSVIVRWRTNAGTDSRVRYGASPGNLTSFVDDLAVDTEHSLTLTGLTPDTTYYYSVGTTSGVLLGDDFDHYFETSPNPGDDVATRIWVVGDSGTADGDAEAVRDAYDQFAGPDHTDLWLMLGDNAYWSGTDAEYEAAVFDMYPDMLRKRVVWPTRGNHEDFAPVYYGNFDLPANAEAGGMPSGSEAYYSFDYANVHFICLDSEGSNNAVGAPMWLWCQSDLEATDQDWIVAYWHHPPYSRGSHDSDTEAALFRMRENFVPLLEMHGVDLVLSGHSHSYERSVLLDGHYGVSSSLDSPTMVLDGGDGDEAGDGAYTKVDEPNAGAVYVVAGSSGKTSNGPLDHPVMIVSLEVLGSFVIDVDGDRLRGRFLDDNDVIRDDFQIDRLGEAFCFGDGSGTPCPCGNTGSSREGCNHSSFIFGMKITASGSTSVTADDLEVTVTQCPTNNSGIFFCGTTSLGPGNTLFDGLQCAGGSVRRFGGQIQTSGTVSDTNFVAQEPSGTYFQAGGSYYFQYWSRDVATGFSPCGNFANFSPGFAVTMTP